ncbi:MAG: SAF domain-containing protein [Anaerocolumna sp.]
MRRRLKRSTKQHIVISLLCIVICGGVFLTAYLTVICNLKKNYQNEIKVLSNQLETKKVYVYEAKDDIKAGNKVTKENLKYIQVLSDQPDENFITKEEIGKIALIDIKTGTEILKSMLTNDMADSSLREVEFNTFLLNSNLKENDVVDIRILYPNGENYIVLSKKEIKTPSLETSNCFMWLSPEELLRVSGAIVDCYLNQGTKLYTVKYIEPRIQEASVITYTPSTDVIQLIKKDPNVLQKASAQLSESIRMELDNRLKQFYGNYNGEITWDQLGSYYHNSMNNTSQIDNSNIGNVTDNTGINATENDQKEESGEEIYYVD